MKRYAKVIASVLTTMMVATALVGCGSSSTGTSGTKNGQTITVWSHLDGPEIPELRKECEAWAKKTGNKVKVVKDSNDFNKLVVVAKSPKAPDVMIGIAHDNTGAFAKAGILDEVPSGTINSGDYLSDSVVDAGKYQGKQYGVPFFTETYALFYNKDKVKNPPTTWDDLVTQAKQVGFEYDVTNFYFSYALVGSTGGYVFKNSNGALNTKDVGLGNQAIPGLTLINNLIKDGFMKSSITGDIAKGDFQSKKTGFYISGPWDVDALKKAGVNFGIVKLPKIDGKDTKSFMGVQVGMVLKNSKNKSLSWDLMKYLQKDENLTTLGKVGNRLPAKKSIQVTDEYSKAFLEQAKNAEAMPNVPEVSAVWDPAKNALQLLVTGKSTPEAAAKAMEDNVTKGIKTMAN
jgi:arabinogalactan oligomer/maltooligosaccharide transport system substrate-binding protein